MHRRSILVAMAFVLTAVLPVGASAATAPGAPGLISVPYRSPAIFSWTPAEDILNTSQTVYRAPGQCASPLATGQAVAIYGPTTNTHHAVPGDGAFCFYVQAADLAGGTAAGPGISLTIDTTPPTSTVAVTGQVDGVVRGTVTINRTSGDATSGVATEVRRVGAVGDCDEGRAVTRSWNTTTLPDGAYDVCNIVTDRAGLVTQATVTVTVTNAVPVVPTPTPIPSPTPSEPIAAPAAAGAATPVATPAAGTTTDKTAPGKPSKLAVVQPRARMPKGKVPLTLRWVNPKATDLARVVAVLNLKHRPASRTDGKVIFSGLRTSAAFKLQAGTRGHVALFAIDRSGNVSKPALRTVSLASLIPLRPLTGTTVVTAPRLSWTATEGTAYYNVQIFRNGRRILTDWPAHASFKLPTALLEPGTYTWFVWPALKGKGSAATFGELIGRATFTYDG